MKCKVSYSQCDSEKFFLRRLSPGASFLYLTILFSIKETLRVWTLAASQLLHPGSPLYASECISMHLNASECVGMQLNASEGI